MTLHLQSPYKCNNHTIRGAQEQFPHPKILRGRGRGVWGRGGVGTREETEAEGRVLAFTGGEGAPLWGPEQGSAL